MSCYLSSCSSNALTRMSLTSLVLETHKGEGDIQSLSILFNGNLHLETCTYLASSISSNGADDMDDTRQRLTALSVPPRREIQEDRKKENMI